MTAIAHRRRATKDIRVSRLFWLTLFIVAFVACNAPFSFRAAAECGPAQYGTPGCPYPSLGGWEGQGIDRPGGDYANFDLQGPYPGDCRDACRKDKNCLAWTFVNPGVQGPNARCWLKSTIPPPQPDSCCISGVERDKPVRALGKRKVGDGSGLSADAQAILNAHNGYRAKHCVPNLTWSAQLATGAQDWANRCPSNGKGGFAHSDGAGAYGENLAWGTGMSGQGSVDMWYSEIGKYNFNAPVWSSAVGHFTQVVWRNSAQLGCAVASCSGQSFWVCRYSPPGNFNVNVPGELGNNVPPPCK